MSSLHEGKPEYVFRTIVSGIVVEKIKTKLMQNKDNKRLSRRERAKRTTYDSGMIPHAARIVNTNFGYRSRDHFMLLTYRPEEIEKLCRRAAKLRKKPKYADYDNDRLLKVAAEIVLDNWIRRVQDKCKKLNIAFKYFAVTADGHDGKGEASTRIHHHIIVSAAAVAVCREKWTAGLSMTEPLWEHQKDRTPLVQYMLNQVKYHPHAKAYRPSRNLEPPDVSSPRIVYSARMPVAPPGAEIMYQSEWRPGMPLYIRFVPKEYSGGEPKQRG